MILIYAGNIITVHKTNKIPAPSRMSKRQTGDPPYPP